MQDQEKYRVADGAAKFWNRDSIEIKMIKPWRWYNWVFPFRREMVLNNVYASAAKVEDETVVVNLRAGSIKKCWRFGKRDLSYRD